MADAAAQELNPARELDISLNLFGDKEANRAVAAGSNFAFRRPRVTMQAAWRWGDSGSRTFALFEKDWRGGAAAEIMPGNALKEVATAGAVRLAHRAKLSGCLDDRKSVLSVHDFGDQWPRLISVGELRADSGGQLPALISGENGASPEGLGGQAGCSGFREIMSSPSREDHKEAKEWAKWQGWEPFGFAKTVKRVYLADSP
jgi:hypothetical protein